MSKVTVSEVEAPSMRVVNVRTIDPARCPHFIMVGDHYREDGSCKCDDEKETVMRAWGYRWNKKTGRWR